jgi:hypothetical protein
MILTKWLTGFTETLSRSRHGNGRGHRRRPQVQDVLRPSDLARRVDALEDRTLLTTYYTFGDAPAPYPVTLAEDGARHLYDEYPQSYDHLDFASKDGVHTSGADRRQFESYAAPKVAEQGGQFAIGSDFWANFDIYSGNRINSKFNRDATWYADAWMDWNRDGDWNDAGERILNRQTFDLSKDETQVYLINVPTSSAEGVTYGRLRVSTSGSNSPTGLAADGFVDDFGIVITKPLASAQPINGFYGVGISNSNVIYGSLSITTFIRDFNNDGLTDFVASHAGGEYGIQIAKADGTFSTLATPGELTGYRNYKSAVGDTDADGILEFVEFGTVGGVGVVSVSSVNSQGALTSWTGLTGYTQGTYDYFLDYSLLDYNGDGRDDLVVRRDTYRDGYVLDVFYGNTNGSLSASQEGNVNIGQPVLSHDFTGNGVPEVITTQGMFTWNGGSLSALASPGTIDSDDGFPFAVTADLDGDGFTELLNGSGSTFTIKEYEGGAWQTRYSTAIRHVNYGDLNGDGRVDVVLEKPTGGISTLVFGAGFTPLERTYSLSSLGIVEVGLRPSPSHKISGVFTNGSAPVPGGKAVIIPAGLDGLDYSGDGIQLFAVADRIPTLNPISTLVLGEDASRQTVNLSGISAGSGESQPLRVTASSSSTGLIPNPTVTYTSANTAGSIAFTPVADASGTATITVTVEDGGLDENLSTAGDNATFSRTFVVSVSAVNDTPTLNALSNVSIAEDSARQTVNLAGITAGGGESQPLRVTASSSSTGLIPNPTVTYTSANPTGSLTFTPVTDQFGTATITVTVEDGGLDGNLSTAGDNATIRRTFDVTVNPKNDAPTLNALSNVSVAVGVAEQTVNLGGITAGTGESQPLRVTATSSSTGLIPNPTVTYTSANTTGSIAFTPVADQSGTATITVTVEDGGPDGDLSTAGDNATFSRTFDVAVGPTLNPLSNVTIAAGAPEQTMNLSGISSGGGEPQPLRVTASSSSTGLIPNPTVTYTSPNATGSVQFTPVPGQNGTTTITVTVEDGGLDGHLSTVGDNGTFSRSFDVTVRSPPDPECSVQHADC